MGRTRSADINTEDLCYEYLKDGATLVSVGKIYEIHPTTVHKRLKKVDDEKVKEKLKYNNSFQSSRNPSKIIDINNESFGIVCNRTGSIHVFPIYAKEYMSQYAWSEDDSRYLSGTIFGDKRKAYHIITGCPLKGFDSDHINGDTRNNMPTNLRILTESLNQHNKRVMKNNTSGYTGVSFDGKKQKWRSVINIGKENFFLGNFETKEEAALMRLSTKSSLLGYEYMREKEIQQYNDLLTYFATNGGIDHV